MRFPNLLGNDRLKSVFANMPADKIGSAIIFDGPSGIGKITAALDLASSLLCTGMHRPCGVCSACKRMHAGTNSDFELFGVSEKTPSVDDVRAMRSRSFVRSGDSGFKVFVIADADRLNHQSQNALLKVLEEPLNSYFILTCNNYMNLLQTVRSRCTVYHLEPLDEESIIRELKKVQGHTDEDRAAAARVCGGSLEKAVQILNDGESLSSKVARAFLYNIGNETELFKTSQSASSLSREEYAAFCDSLSSYLVEEIKKSSSPAAMISIYEYIQSQINMLAQNPSVSALSGALVAFCGEVYGG